MEEGALCYITPTSPASIRFLLPTTLQTPSKRFNPFNLALKSSPLHQPALSILTMGPCSSCNCCNGGSCAGSCSCKGCGVSLPAPIRPHPHREKKLTSSSTALDRSTTKHHPWRRHEQTHHQPIRQHRCLTLISPQQQTDKADHDLDEDQRSTWNGSEPKPFTLSRNTSFCNEYHML
jgi:hypothetical protein